MNNLSEIEQKLQEDIAHMTMVSYLDGTIATLKSLKKGFDMYGTVNEIPLHMIQSHLDDALQEQEQRLEAVKKEHIHNQDISS